ncbi:MAG: 2-C-methyl-D-erythritol 2,4-cyclodiphosphate synthase [bacterium]|nr:2-C-methyl-D-erythritol 2,4-cyclodiphosphate synthase [bacterium]MBK8130581.1 2-C-methyl-D-erythritol 2,4-cyclodiphosphate synthase [bacterium]
MSTPFRVGVGVDAHRFVSGRPLVLGGVEIAFPFGLEAHSDGDVICHAILDALLGAANVGDKGKLFPPTDPKFKDARSTDLLHEAMRAVNRRGYNVVNLDVSVMCEEPRIAPYREEMRDAIATALAMDIECVSIKGTTLEGMGFTGRKEGIAAVATVLLSRE